MGRCARWQPGQHVNWGDHPAECFSYSLVGCIAGCYWVLVANFDQHISKSITNCWSQFFLQSSDTCEFKELGIFKITLSGFVPWWSSSTREFAPQRAARLRFPRLSRWETFRHFLCNTAAECVECAECVEFCNASLEDVIRYPSHFPERLGRAKNLDIWWHLRLRMAKEFRARVIPRHPAQIPSYSPNVWLEAYIQHAFECANPWSHLAPWRMKIVGQCWRRLQPDTWVAKGSQL